MTTSQVAIYNLKGGTGKTTLTTGLAAAAARAGGRILVKDADPAQDAVTVADGWTGIRTQPWSPGEPPPDDVDLVLIDCPPDAQKAAEALEEADLVVVPVALEHLAVRRLAQMLTTLPPDKPFAVVVNQAYRGADADEQLAALDELLGGDLWRPVVPRRTTFPRSQAMRVPPQEMRGRPLEVVEALALLAARLLAWTPPRTS